MDIKIVIIIGIIVVVIVVIAIFFNKKARIKRKITKNPHVRISEAKSGRPIRVSGRVELFGEVLRAPLSNRPCGHYYVHIEQESGGKNRSWHTLIEDEQIGNYVIRDGKSYAFIKSKKVKTYVVEDSKQHSGFLNDANPKLERYLKMHGEKSTSWLGLNKKIRYKEGVFEENETIVVAGVGTWKIATDIGLPEKYGKVLQITPEQDDYVYISDDPDIKKA